MWNNTRVLNIAANLMIAVALVIVLKLLALACLNTSALPLRTINVVGDVDRVSADQLGEAFAGRSLGNFFSADLDEVRTWVEAVPWVRQARVRRVWPDRLEVSIEAQRPIARWSGRELVNTWGELFAGEVNQALPRFSGPSGSEMEVTDHYHRFRVVVKSLGRELTAVTLTSRYSWELTLSDGLSIVLGRDTPEESAEDRLVRLTRIYPDTIAHLPRGKFTRIDLRYPNGFALRVPDLPAMRGDKPVPGAALPTPPRKPATSASIDSLHRPA
jgi:cell division protein FtsQ